MDIKSYTIESKMKFYLAKIFEAIDGNDVCDVIRNIAAFKSKIFLSCFEYLGKTFHSCFVFSNMALCIHKYNFLVSNG